MISPPIALAQAADELILLALDCSCSCWTALAPAELLFPGPLSSKMPAIPVKLQKGLLD